MDRLTYKSTMGDYGCAKDFESIDAERCAFRNKLGKYEDLGYSPEQLEEMLKEILCKNEK